MLESVKLLHSMGYVLYGSSGTADFYNEHGITVRVFSCCLLYCDQNLQIICDGVCALSLQLDD